MNDKTITTFGPATSSGTVYVTSGSTGPIGQYPYFGHPNPYGVDLNAAAEFTKKAIIANFKLLSTIERDSIINYIRAATAIRKIVNQSVNYLNFSSSQFPQDEYMSLYVSIDELERAHAELLLEEALK